MSKPTVIYSPLWPEHLTKMRLNNGKAVIHPIIGRMKLCNRCDEHWPADSDFFHTSQKKKDGLNNWCKACYREFNYGMEPYKLTKKQKTVH